jgi:hypothetical protein
MGEGEGKNMKCQICDQKIRINWGSSNDIRCERHMNNLSESDENMGEKVLNRTSFIFLILGPIIFAFFPLIIGFILLGLSKFGLYKETGGEAALAFLTIYTMPIGLIAFLIGVVIFVFVHN